MNLAKYPNVTAIFLVCMVLSGVSQNSYAQSRGSEAKDDLSVIQQQLEATKQQKLAREKRRTALFTELKKQESRIAELALELNQTRIQITQNQFSINDLEIQRDQYAKRIDSQKSKLIQQIRSAHASGDYDLAKVIFNQQNVAEFERFLTYYQFVYQARKANIDEFRTLLTQISDVETDLKQKQDTLLRLGAKLEEQQIELSSEQFARQKSISALEAQIESDIARIQQLEEDELRLTQAIEEAARRQASVKLVGLKPVKGTLIQPAQGNKVNRFGRTRQGQLKWKGITITGQSGSNIKSVHSGKVVYADWLRGFGLVVVVDHGDGYMTVYGHNQALLKAPGDEVKRGEVIALMGQSGGQSRPNLYFELRHKGIPINPKNWFG